MEINEELIEEIGMEIFHYAKDANPKTYQTAEDIIALVLSAVRDGKQKLEGEAGRWIPTSAGGDEAGGGFAWRILKEIGRAPILIALNPEEQK